MLMHKITEACDRVGIFLTDLYLRPETQQAIGTFNLVVAAVCGWLKGQVEAQPQAAMAGGIAAALAMMVLSAVTMGLALTMACIGAAAVGAHYYITQTGEMAAENPRLPRPEMPEEPVND